MVSHWIFFFTYFECAITSSYIMNRQKIPRAFTVAFFVVNVIVILVQIEAPVMTFTYAQLINNYYYSGSIDNIPDP